MAAKLTLKNRRSNDTVPVRLADIKVLLEAKRDDGQPASDSEKARLWERYFAGLRDRLTVTHDKRWLAEIVNYVPRDKPTALTNLVPWLKLAERVGRLEEKDSGGFTLSVGQIELIWKRLNDPEFKWQSFPTQFAEFVLDFCAATGKRFSGLDDDLMYDDEIAETE